MKETSINSTTTPLSELDKPRTFRAAAEALGVGYHIIQRGAKRGLIPTYSLGTSRRYVLLRDIQDLMRQAAPQS